MDEIWNLRQQTYFVSANERPSSLWSWFDKTNLQVVTCKFPKVYKCLLFKLHLQVYVQVILQVLLSVISVLISDRICLTVISTVKLEFRSLDNSV